MPGKKTPVAELKAMSEEERKDFAIESTINRGNKNRQLTDLKSNGYLSDPNVRFVHNQVQKRGFTKIGRPTAFQDDEKLRQELSEYFELCNDRGVMPVVAGMSNWLGVGWSTLYDHANNPNSPYSATLKYALQLVHEITQSAATNNKLNPMIYMFLAGNYWGMKDVRQINVSPVSNDNLNNNQKDEILEALRQEARVIDMVDESENAGIKEDYSD